MTWCMKRTNIYLAEGQAAALDRVAEAEGVSRAELIDRAIGGHPGADLAADLAAINGSFGILAEQEEFSRAQDRRMDYLDRIFCPVYPDFQPVLAPCLLVGRMSGPGRPV